MTDRAGLVFRWQDFERSPYLRYSGNGGFSIDWAAAARDTFERKPLSLKAQLLCGRVIHLPHLQREALG